MRVLGLIAITVVVAAGCGSQPSPPHSNAPPSAMPVVSAPPATSAAPNSVPPVVGRSLADTGLSWANVPCPNTSGEFDGEIHQQMDGEVSTCLQVGAVGPGAYAITSEQFLAGGRPADRPASAPAIPGQAPSVQLSLSPDTGLPGTVVTVSGTLTAPLQQQPDNGDLCWDSCPDGLRYSGVQLQWTSRTTFRTSMVVPAAPWLDANPARVARLVSGSYSIGIQCLDDVKSCALLGPQGSAPFHLQVPAGAAPAWCATQTSCAHLTVSPGSALPGDVINVHGFAPLTWVIGADQAYAPQLQTRPGPASATAVNFGATSMKGEVFADLGQGALTVRAAPTFGSLDTGKVIDQISDGFLAVVADPANPATHAWCDRSSAVVSSANGTRTVPTAQAAGVLTRMGFPPYDDSNLGCMAVAFVDDIARADPPALVVAFGVEPPDQNPMSATVALVTLDNGRTWKPVPAPKGAQAIDFGDFRYQHGALVAAFNPGSPSASGLPPLAETSRDGGRTWAPTTLGCPTAGPCVTFGAFQSGNCAKGQATQAVLRSTDSGGTWSEPPRPGWIGACAPAQLAATASGAELLVDNMSEFTLRRSTDSGVTWVDIAVPLLPNQQPGFAVGIGADGVVIMPNGSLLATGQQDSWLILRSGSDAWCRVTTPGTGLGGIANSTITIIGSQLWWLTYDQSGAATPHHVEIAALSW